MTCGFFQLRHFRAVFFCMIIGVCQVCRPIKIASDYSKPLASISDNEIKKKDYSKIREGLWVQKFLYKPVFFREPAITNLSSCDVFNERVLGNPYKE